MITVASANRADILDPAPVRPGWFDRKINFIPKPGLIVRMEILYVSIDICIFVIYADVDIVKNVNCTTLFVDSCCLDCQLFIFIFYSFEIVM